MFMTILLEAISGASLANLGAAFAAAAAVFAAAMGISRIGCTALESIARQPEAAGDIRSGMILSAALIEGVAMFAIVVCFLVLFVQRSLIYIRMSLLLPDAGLLFWMLLAFGVVFAVLYKFGFPIITSMIEARKQYIDEALKGAKEANEKIANIEQQCNGLIEEARQRQVEILREATAAREQIIREAREKADAETAKIVADAKREIEQQRQDALNSLREEAAKVAIAVSEKILRKELTSQASQQEYIGKLVDETEKELKAANDK